MKHQRFLCAILALTAAFSLFTLPAQAAAKPAFQWLVSLTKNEGTYDAETRSYVFAFYMNGSESDAIALQYDTTDGKLYCMKFWSGFYTILELTPNLETPYRVTSRNGNTYGAEYHVYPGSYTEAVELHYDKFYGDPAYHEHIDMQLNADLPAIVEMINNVMVIAGSSYRVKDLGFAKFTYHGMHIYSEPEPVGPFVCGTNNYYTCHCLICGETVTTNKYESHIQGDFVWVREPTCTEIGYGYYICARCGAQMGGGSFLYHSELGHDWEMTALYEPITGASHVLAHYRCTRCGEEMSDEFCAAHDFSDMPARGSWSHMAIDWAYAGGITAGTSAASFSPDKTCTRAQVATFLWRAMGCPEPSEAEIPFTDVKDGQYYTEAVLWALENGVTNGTGPTTFSPDQGCTRAQVVTFLWRAAGAPDPSDAGDPFSDVDPEAYYYKAVLWAVEKGITNGTSAGAFSPDSTCTRAQIVTFLFRAQVE